jgi:hypothetical protein
MRTTVSVLSLIIKVAAVVQLVLGILFWTGHAITYSPVLIVVGSALVVALWGLAAIALAAGVKRGLAVFELVWGLALASFGMVQAGILIGSLHWIIRVIHLAMAIVAVKLGEGLGNTVLGASSERAAEQIPSARRASS